MLLGVVERIGLLQILPKQGDFLTLRIIHELRQSLSFTEEETAEFGLETDEVAQTVRWDQRKTREVEIPIGPKARSIVEATLKRLDKEALLTEQHMTLYERFIEGVGTENGHADKPK